MISETAFFIQDVIGPRGSASIIMSQDAAVSVTDNHTKTAGIRLHKAEISSDGNFVEQDANISMGSEPGLQALCNRQQQFVLEAITKDIDLRDHMDDAIGSLAIAFAADLSVSENRSVCL